MKEASPYKNRFGPLSFRISASTAPPLIKVCMVSTDHSESTGEKTDGMSPELEAESREYTSCMDLARDIFLPV